MRVMECNLCGDAVSGANDDDLVASLRRHVDEHHPDAGIDEDQARELVAQRAYDASDS